MFGYFRWAKVVVKSHKLRQVVGNRCMALEFITQLAANDADAFQDKLGEVLSTMGEYLNTATRGWGGVGVWGVVGVWWWW